MERAASAVAAWIIKNKNYRVGRVVVLCGPGNNGGDGFAIARLLMPFYDVICCALETNAEQMSPDCRTNYERFVALGGRVLPADIAAFNELNKEKTLIVDALFGSGLNKPVRGVAAQLIECLNASGVPVVSVDVPSGMHGDDCRHLSWSGAIVRSHHTVTFQAPYRSFFLPENAPYIPTFSVADIGLLPDFLGMFSDQLDQNFYVTSESLVPLIRGRAPSGHKGTFGRVLIVGGRTGMCGAAMLSARAAKAIGTGLVYLGASEACRESAQSALPEIIFHTLEDSKTSEIKAAFPVPDVVAVGPGWGREGGTAGLRLMAEVWPHARFVLDADALNRLAKEGTDLSLFQGRTVITPHPGEFDRLFPIMQESPNSERRLARAREEAKKWQVVIVLKGRYSAISLPDGSQLFNTSGNHWLATGGSGDILTGMIAGLLAQGYTPEEAALLGVWLHGHAADLATEKKYKPVDLNDLLLTLPEAMRALDFARQA
jgi:NAD(P)H-hydrate epimerase